MTDGSLAVDVFVKFFFISKSINISLTRSNDLLMGPKLNPSQFSTNLYLHSRTLRSKDCVTEQFREDSNYRNRTKATDPSVRKHNGVNEINYSFRMNIM